MGDDYICTVVLILERNGSLIWLSQPMSHFGQPVIAQITSTPLWKMTWTASFPGWTLLRQRSQILTSSSSSASSSLSSLTLFSLPSSSFTTTCGTYIGSGNIPAFQRVNFFMISICIRDMSFALILIALCQPGTCLFKFVIKSFQYSFFLIRLQRGKLCRLCEQDISEV